MVKNETVWFPGAIYYISCYDSRNETIFSIDSDYIEFLSLVENVRYQYPFYLHAYSLTTSTIQLLLETTHVPIQDILKKLSIKKMNNQLQLIDSVAHFLEASKTIHLFAISKTYRWSSYLSFISSTPNDHVVTSRILNYFPNPKMENYRLFVEEEESRSNNHSEVPEKEAFI